jgi:pimeloyl-ACP methyl ester carboxylesterase
VFCLPIHEEQKSAYRPCVDAARAAAADGVACARFHYAGTDESDGDALDLTFESMVADILGVAGHLRARVGLDQVSLVGIRLGASAALAAAEWQPGITGVMAIEPVYSGRTYVSRALTRKRVRRMVTEAEGGSQPVGESPAEDEADGGVIDFDGHPISPGQRASLEAVSLVDRAGRIEAPILILEVAARDRTSKQADDLRASLSARGATVLARTMVTEPFWNSLGVVSLPELTREIVSFVTDPFGAVSLVEGAHPEVSQS